VELAPLVKAECEALRARAEQKGVSLEIHLDAATVQGAPDLLVVLVRNLLDNAIRYSSAHGRAIVTCATVDGHAQLSVADDGPGIPPEERPHVFERFYRILGSGEVGSGLGLSIVKRIAELHKASVEIRDGVAGRGTTLLVTFAD
jgi:two-component system sensor histidine kinase QseC